MQNRVDDDPYLWLEEVESGEALDWVKARNAETQGRLENAGGFREMEARSLEILDSEEKLAYPQMLGDTVYNFWRDSKHVRGLLRRMPLSAYLDGAQDWEPVLDVDRLAEDEGENWVYKGHQALAPDFERTLVWLSRGGSDACVVREFDLSEKTFVPDGFVIPEAKSDLAWKDKDTLYVGTKFDENSVTDSGYPRVIKVWRRGTPLQESVLLFEVQKTDLAASAWVVRRKDEQHDFLCRTIDFWNEEHFYLLDGQHTALPLPTDAPVRGFFKGRLLLLPRSDWRGYKAGSLLAVELDPLLGGRMAVSALYDAALGGTVETVNCLLSSVIVGITESVKTALHHFKLVDGQWRSHPLEIQGDGAEDLVAGSAWSDDFFLTYESFLTPTTLFYREASEESREIARLPERFDAEDMHLEQLWATSLDGTEVPYYLLRHAEMPPGQAPTLLYAYGGFEVSLLPRYLPLVGINWLAKGGIYVSANIRGGGEFGPSWHQAALREKRHKAYEDLEAVARDLVARGYTTANKIAVHGASNGGLLTGNMLTRSPHLFGAVLIGVPLLDMKRYHKLLAGASWMAEYGDPDNPDDWEFLRSYSPYHKVSKEVKYPPVLLYTSTKDDRVHPGHARKMVAKLKGHGHVVDYYENLEGGHAGVSNNKQQAYLTALIYTYLWEKLSLNGR